MPEAELNLAVIGEAASAAQLERLLSERAERAYDGRGLPNTIVETPLLGALVVPCEGGMPTVCGGELKSTRYLRSSTARTCRAVPSRMISVGVTNRRICETNIWTKPVRIIVLPSGSKAPVQPRTCRPLPASQVLDQTRKRDVAAGANRHLRRIRGVC